MNTDCCCKPGCNAAACGCCAGIEPLTPRPTVNRPGLAPLSYRMGTHAIFLETMKARLSSSKYSKLARLTSREADDFSLAIMDAWATVADVLTFYQERIVNEGFLRTATERRSVLELGRLVGYQPRPGVASSVYLAYTIDDNFKEETIIPKGARSQSIPGPGEMPQSFETSEDIKARAQWNDLKPRINKPQTLWSILLDPIGPRIFLQGINTNLKPNDPLLIDFMKDLTPIFVRVKEVIPNPIANRSLIRLETTTEALVINTSSIFEILDQGPKVALILLDSGDGLSGFFKLEYEEGKEIIILSSVTDGGKWSMQFESTPSRGDIYIKLQNPDGSFVYKKKVVAIDLVKLLVLEYFRIKLQDEQKNYSDLIKILALPPSTQPSSASFLNKNLTEQFVGSTMPRTEVKSPSDSEFSSLSTGRMQRIEENGIIKGLTAVADGSNAALKILSPKLAENLVTATANADVTASNPIKVYALRVKASMFGSNAPDMPKYEKDKQGMIKIINYTKPLPIDMWNELIAEDAKGMPVIATDTQLEQVQSGSWLVIDRPKLINREFPNQSSGRIITVHRVLTNQIESRSAQGATSKISLLTLNHPWLNDLDSTERKIFLERSTTLLRSTLIHAQSEELKLAEEPVADSICGGEENLIELDGFYEDLQAGRWVIVSGERADVSGTKDVRSSELAMISVTKQDISRQNLYLEDESEFTLPGDRVHTFIKLANELAYCFKRDTVRIHGNVVKATHGETRKETLGSGDGAKALQSFTLKQPPLTYVAATNPSGVDSTLNVYVNDVQWHETNTLVDLSSTARNFSTKTDDEGKTTVVFGNGREGARLPTGIENIKAEYRNGIGKAGNVKAEQISLLTTRPLGVKAVINPLRASGGADKETRDQARRNVPLGVKALDRLVSVQDYEDFTRIFAGVGKARAVELSDGSRQLVHITIAGADDIPIEPHSDLFRNLQQALLDSGDPYQAIELEIRELMLIVITAGIRILPDYQWESVESLVRTALLDAFSFDRRELGQDVLLSEVISVMQAVRGVAYVDVDIFGGLPEKIIRDEENKARELCTPADIASIVEEMRFDKGKLKSRPDSRIPVNLARTGAKLPAQLAFMTPDVPATLNLIQIS